MAVIRVHRLIPGAPGRLGVVALRLCHCYEARYPCILSYLLFGNGSNILPIAILDMYLFHSMGCTVILIM